MPDQDKQGDASPSAAARGRRQPKRFYKEATTAREDGGWALLLDGKPVRTPGKRPLLLPSAAIADAVAAEWRGQEGHLDPETMPLTRIANSVIDGVAGQEAQVVDDILAYAGADLLCYRADGPKGLVSLQSRLWDPVLDWARDELGAWFLKIQGVTHSAQPEASLAALRRVVAGYGDFELAALHLMTALGGSALLALAVAKGRFTAEEAWEAAHADEDWQISQWGEDAEAAERRQRRRQEFEAAARVLDLVRAA